MTVVEQIAAELGETDPEAIERITEIIEALGGDAALGLVGEVHELRRRADASAVLTDDERKILYRGDGERRSLGGSYFQAARRRIPRRAPAPPPPPRPRTPPPRMMRVPQPRRVRVRDRHVEVEVRIRR